MRIPARALLAVLALGAGVAASGAASASAATTFPTATTPGAALFPIKGVAYQPTPSNYTPCTSPCVYYDTDFYNADFAGLWSSANGGRGDLATLQTNGVNLLHLYDWNPARNHLPFLNAAQQSSIEVAVPISNYFVGSDGNEAADIASIVNQVYVDATGAASTTPHPAVGMLTIANEYDLSGISAAQVAQAAADVVAAEQALGATQLLPISVPVSFGVDPTLGSSAVPGVNATQAVMTAFTNQATLGASFVSSRFIAATNPQNDGSYLSGGLPNGQSYFAAFSAAIPDTPLWFSELGTGELLSCSGYPSPCTPGEAQQETFNAGQWAVAVPGAGGVLLGSAQFEFEDEPWKGPSATTNDATFGMYLFTPGETPQTFDTTGGQPYLVDALTAKPALTAMTDAFGGSLMVTAASTATAAAARAAGAPVRIDIDARDVAKLDRSTYRWSTVLDGAKAGIARGNAIDAFTLARDGTLLLSLARGQRLPGAGVVRAGDVVRYDTRRHAFERALRGTGRRVDALAVTPTGRVVVSKVGSSDLLVRSGRGWKTYLTGSELGLDRPSEDVDAAWIDPASGHVYLSTRGSMRSGAVRGTGTDVLAARRDARGWHTRLAWSGAANGIANANVTGFAIAR